MSNSIEFLRGQVPPELRTAVESITSPLTYLDTTGVAGSATANTNTGRSSIATGQTSCVVTNNKCFAASVVLLQVEDLDSVGLDTVVVPAAGHFTVTGAGASNADAKFRWAIVS